MAVSLQKGQRVGLGNSMQYALVGLGWDSNKYDGGYDFDLDASAFLLGANGKVIRDEDFVFYNNLDARDGAVRSMGDDTTGGNSDGGEDEQPGHRDRRGPEASVPGFPAASLRQVRRLVL